jgi:hypothetical protein
MLRTTAITISALTLFASAAMAQTTWMPPGSNDAPGGANGAAPHVGANTPNVADTINGGTNSTDMTEQRAKQQSAGAPAYYTNQQAQMSMGEPTGHVRHRVALTDEFGFKYDSRGDRLDANGFVMPSR